MDRRSVATVAIIGNDAVLAAAPATPVQLSHACIRRGFTVAVPTSWGDELVAAEAVRRLASREKGPAVMCVCPFVRSRLLAPGPDLAPFLVSLVSPPVATARYLRAAYGDQGVHITYIGACPSAEDPAIDARLTPDAFLADIAEQGIALSEQPLVFDSIVPPDRRRWCSLPGGVPTAEVLWSDSDTRTLVEIDRDDVSTDLAQHIMTREHVLLDLAPSLGCVCSGAISSLPARSARVAVTALEPPRALGPVMDPATVVSLELPVPVPPGTARVTSVASVAPLVESEPLARSTEIESLARLVESEIMESRLDEMLGTPVVPTPIELELEAELDAEVAAEITSPSWAEEAIDDPPIAYVPEPLPELLDAHDASDTVIGSGVLEPAEELNDAIRSESVTTAEVVEVLIRAETVTIASGVVVADEPDNLPEQARPTIPETRATGSGVRRRTPAPMPARYPTSSIPKATASDGRALPRAYVAKRRTPTGGMPAIGARPHSTDGGLLRSNMNESVSPPNTPVSSSANGADIETTHDIAEPVQTVTATDVESSLEGIGPSPMVATNERESGSAFMDHAPPPNTKPSIDQATRPESNRGAGAVAAPVSNHGALIVLLVTLLALGFFVLRSLR